MNIKNGDMPANPLRGANNVPFSQADYGGISNMMMGLSKREAFAMAAMQGMCANQIPNMDDDYKELSIHAVATADALLKELG